MAHNESYKSKSFEDAGWKSMQSILDKEMPVVEEKKRIGIVWWIGSAAAIMLLIGAFILGSDDISSSLSPVASNDVHELNNESSKIEKPNLDNSSINSVFPPTKNDYGKENVKSIITTAPLTPTTQTNKVIQSSYPLIVGADPSNASSKQESKTTISNVIIHPPKPLNNTSSYNRLTRLPTTEVSIIDGIDISAIDAGAVTSSIPQLELLNKNKYWNLNAFTNRSTSKGYSEIGIGVQYNWVLNRRWKLTSGLNYIHRINVFNQKIGTGDEALNADLQDPSFGSTVSAAQDLNFFQAVNRNLNAGQLETVLALTYEFAYRWRLSGMISPSYYLIDESKYNEILNPQDQNNLAFQDATDPINNWNIHFGIGIGRQLSESLALNLSYNFLTTRRNINSITPPNFEADEWRLTVKYALD